MMKVLLYLTDTEWRNLSLAADVNNWNIIESYTTVLYLTNNEMEELKSKDFMQSSLITSVRSASKTASGFPVTSPKANQDLTASGQPGSPAGVRIQNLSPEIVDLYTNIEKLNDDHFDRVLEFLSLNKQTLKFLSLNKQTLKNDIPDYMALSALPAERQRAVVQFVAKLLESEML